MSLIRTSDRNNRDQNTIYPWNFMHSPVMPFKWLIFRTHRHKTYYFKLVMGALE